MQPAPCLHCLPADEATEAQGAEAMSHLGSQDLCPQGHSQPGLPCFPSPLHPRIWALSAGRSHPDLGLGSCWRRCYPTGPGREWSVEAGLRAGLALSWTCITRLPLWVGEQGGQGWWRALCVALPVEVAGLSVWSECWAAGFGFWFCCVALPKSLTLSGCLCYVDKIISEVTGDRDSAHLTQRGWCPWDFPSHCPAS